MGADVPEDHSAVLVRLLLLPDVRGHPDPDGLCCVLEHGCGGSVQVMLCLLLLLLSEEERQTMARSSAAKEHKEEEGKQKAARWQTDLRWLEASGRL